MRFTLLLLLSAAALAAAAGIEPSIDAPGGLSPDQVPQFVLLTHDDGVDGEARRTMHKVTDGRQTSNGCPVTATMFTLKDPDGWTDCKEVKKMYEQGFEIADHTITHESMPGTNRTFLEDEIVRARKEIAKCGVPEEDIVGFRPPYLNTDPAIREILHENGFLYDSSIIEDWQWSVSEGFGNRLWPFDLEYGIPINCSLVDLVQDGTIQNCDADESWPGLYEVPVWRYSNLTAGDLPYAMDPGYTYECECMNDTHTTFDILKANFDETYAGNRAPFPIYIHIYWLQAENNLEELQKFVDYALGLPDVYFVTMRQLLAWMENPIPKDELTPEKLGCGNPGGAPGTLAKSSEKKRRERLRRRLSLRRKI